MKLIRRLFGIKSDPEIRQPSKELPPGWNLTISNLMSEMKAGKRKSINKQELDWAREYERSLIPDNARFPQKGDIYESLIDQTVSYLTHWAAPFTGGGEATLLQGERVRIHSDPGDDKPIGAYALPVEYKKLEKRMVPIEAREISKYGGFSFYFTTMELNERFRLVKTRFAIKGD